MPWRHQSGRFAGGKSSGGASSEAICRPARRVKNRSMGNENSCGSEQKDTCIVVVDNGYNNGCGKCGFSSSSSTYGPHSHTSSTLGVVGTSSRAVARAFASKPQPHEFKNARPPELSPVWPTVARPPVLLPARSKKPNSLLQQCHNLIDRGSDLGEAMICSWICGTGTAKIAHLTKTTLHKLCLQHSKGDSRTAVA